MNPSSSSPLGDEMQSIRGRSLELLDQFAQTTSAYELPPPPEALQLCRRKLQENRYTVLVAGEAKRGKSTFLNALVGRTVLPTDVDIATCQVFRLRHADAADYRVRFEDGSALAISAADLPRYGSQVVADAGALPALNQRIRWIEVDLPIRFLPREITLLDTPGLGSLYAAHGRILQQFVPEADAVLFVLHSDSPISREEIAFLHKLLRVTRNVLCVQTMIDRYQREHWQTIQQRNEQILAEQFGDRLPDKRVWPISSLNLLQAARTGDRDYERVSKYHPLASALQAFLFRAAGWGRTAEALLVARAAHQAAGTILSARSAYLLDTAHQRPDVREQLAERLGRFEKQWGDYGRQRAELLAGISQAASAQRREFWRSLQPSCSLEVGLQEKIDAVRSLDQARQLADGLSSEVVEAAAEHWRKATQRLQADCLKLLEPFVQATGFATGLLEESSVNPAARSGRRLNLADDPTYKAMVASDQFIEGTTLTGGVILTLVVFTSGWFPPAALVGAVAAGICYAIRGWKLADATQVEGARAALQQHLAEVFQQIRRHFFEEDAATACLGVADQYFDSQVRLLTGRVVSLAALKLEEGQTELKRLLAAADLDERQRQQQAAALQRQRAEWDVLGRSLREVQLELRECGQKLGLAEDWSSRTVPATTE